jgi:ATP-dependent protease ClpP protease subunit
VPGADSATLESEESTKLFRPNPGRGVHVNDQIDEVLVAKLSPIILGLWHQSPDPITLYINSPGGKINCSAMIEGLLKTRSPDGDHRRVIGVGTGYAWSAAADLLVNSSYAVAFPSCSLIFHGVRVGSVNDLTREDAIRFAENLQGGNDQRAETLAQSAFSRVLFRYLYYKSEFEEIRRTVDPQLSDTACFRIAACKRVSLEGGNLCIHAIERHEEMISLWRDVVPDADPDWDEIRYDEEIIKSLIRHRDEMYKKEGKTWSLAGGGIDEVVREYKLLQDFLVPTHRSTIDAAAKTYRDQFIDPVDEKAVRDQQLDGPGAEMELMKRARLKMMPLWYYTFFLCRSLMERDIFVSPLDAFWLGLIDEVVGEDLPTLRVAIEGFRDTVQGDLPLSES